MTGCGLCCSGESDPAGPAQAPFVEEEPTPGESKGLIGLWSAPAPDSDTARSSAQIAFDDGGRLRVVVTLRSGGQLNFGGTWSLDGDVLTLAGGFFSPSGQAEVRCSIEENLLVLVDTTSGQSQEWARVADAAGITAIADGEAAFASAEL